MRAVVAAFLLLSTSIVSAAELPKMKFDEVKEIAPGVFFRFSSISATDKKVPFGGSNNIWIIFEDYVVVVDANFPKEAGDVLAAVKKTTNKPVRYVLDTHHHGDHAYGNAVWAKAGATIVAQAKCAKLLRLNGPKEFAEAGKGPTGRKDVAASTLKVPNLIFDDKLVLDDGTQRVEFLFFGHAHTPGDACAYLPKQKILCTGDACVNGAYNYMGHSDSASWIRALEKMQQLNISVVCPGHGPLARKDLLEKQKRYFAEMRQAVKKGIDSDRELADITKTFKPAWYKEWTGVDPAPDNVKHVYQEMTGQVTAGDVEEDLGILEGPSLTKGTPGWTKPKKIVVPAGLMPARLAELKRAAPEIEFVPAKDADAAIKLIADADAVINFPQAEVLKAGKNLRWVHAGRGGASDELRGALKGSKAALTDFRRADGPPTADQALALLLALSRGLAGNRGARAELRGKTMLVIGLGGTGTQIARRANAFGMRVRAIDPRETEKPSFVFSLNKPEKLMELLPLADVVVLASPLTTTTKGTLGAKQFQAMKKTAYVINSAHTGLVDLNALADALEAKTIAGAGLDTTDVGPLAGDHPLRSLPGVVLTAHRGSPSPEAVERRWRLLRDNVRRFANGEPLLGVVDRNKGS
jgi:phosphoglycerate dehydrogenase-like enzyme/glyoxylase-like metal-dependent hydrolase (beta-lactamase superfamily II)